jgi:hypothetical protein
VCYLAINQARQFVYQAPIAAKLIKEQPLNDLTKHSTRNTPPTPTNPLKSTLETMQCPPAKLS